MKTAVVSEDCIVVQKRHHLEMLTEHALVFHLDLAAASVSCWSGLLAVALDAHLHLCDVELSQHCVVVAIVAVDRSRPQ
jgi:hypothetical protein